MVDPVPNKEEVSAMKRLFHLIKAAAMMALSLYTIIVLFQSISELNRTDLQLSDTPPADKCLPFFDKVKDFKNKHKNNTYALYDFRGGSQAIVRVCTGESEATADDFIGKSYRSNPWKLDGKCDVINDNAARDLFLQRCIPGSGYSSDYTPTCDQFLGVPAGKNIWHMHWNHYLVSLSGKNHTFRNGTKVTLRGSCWVQVNKINAIPNCTVQNVLPYREVVSDIKTVIIVAVVVAFIHIILQCIAVYKYHKGGATAEDGWLVGWADKGAVGGFHEAYWRFCLRSKEGGEIKYGDYPDTHANFFAVVVCTCDDALSGLAVPIVYILGCRLDRFPVPAALIVLKGLKILFDVAMWLYSYGDAQEPGEFYAQGEYHRILNAENAAKDASPQHTSSNAV